MLFAGRMSCWSACRRAFTLRCSARLVPLLSPGQILLINPGYLSTAYVLGLCDKPEFIIAESESNFIDGAYRRLAASMWAFAT